MAKALTAILASLFGLIAGVMAGHFLALKGSSGMERAIAGAMVGAFGGVIGGAAGGDLAGQGKDASRTYIGLLAGAVCGALGGSQSDILRIILNALNIRFSL